jgi:hypothetical protein
MAGPSSIRQAVEWVREAVQQGRYLTHEPHFGKRCRERGISLVDAVNAIRNATACATYDGRAPSQDGTNWRVTGPCIEGTPITVGVEAFLDEQGRTVLLITVF